MSEPLFRRKQLVRHKASGGIYRIIYEPARCRIEASGEPAYAYRDLERRGPVWVRAQTIMEDGRFEPLPQTTQARKV